MCDVRFYSLRRRALDDALPEILEAALADGLRVAVQAPSRERVDALSERLWTYRDDSFLPHAAAVAGDAVDEPIALTDGDENPNGATCRVLVDGAAPETALAVPGAYSRIAVVFDGREESAKADARRHWALAKTAGHAPSFWREGDDGAWERVA